MKIRNKKIFITGGAGFVGSNLVDKLIKDNGVTVYDNLSSGKKEFLSTHMNRSNFRLIVGDLLGYSKLKKSIKGHDFVFHLASNPDISRSEKQPKLDLDQGIIATFNVLEAMRITNIAKIVYPSGSGVYGDQGEKHTKEDFGPLFPVSMYGASKLAAEGLISAFCHLYGMQSWIFRPANIVGPHQTHGVVYDFINKLSENPNQLKILGDGSQSKSYIYIDDFIKAAITAIENTDEKINLFNVSNTDFITVKEIAHMTANAMNIKNAAFQYSGGKKGWKGDIPKVRLDITKIKKLGWKPALNSKKAVKRSIEELIQELCKQ